MQDASPSSAGATSPGTRRIEPHLTIVAALHIAFGLLGLLTFAFGFFVVLGTGIAMWDFEGAALGTSIAALALLILAVLSLPGILGGLGLILRKGWARMLLLVVAFIQLINLPFGTALGAYTLWVLLQEEARQAMDG